MLMPASALFSSLAARIATDAAKLNSAPRVWVAPIIAPYTPSLALVFADITILAADAELGPLRTPANPAVGFSPVTQQWEIWIPTPVLGWRWHPDGSNVNLPVTIYGFALLNAGQSEVYAVTDPLATPIVIPVGVTGTKYPFELGRVALNVVSPFMS